MNVKAAFLGLLLLYSAARAGAVPMEDESTESVESTGGIGGKGDYQIGGEWGKMPVTGDSLRSASAEFTRAARATAKVETTISASGRRSVGTSFYLGKFNGHHVMATNYHVLTNDGHRVVFPLLGKTFDVEKVYGRWSDIELALFSIKVKSPDDEALLASVGRNFDFDATPPAGELLLSVGFGGFQNPEFKMVGIEDSDCKVFSATGDVRFIKDPDQINPADYRVWSFATGCDTSHGDSGSAIVDRVSGAPVGLIWTTGNPKPKDIRDSSHLADLLESQGPEVWSALSYAAPASKIRDFLLDYMNRTRFRDRDELATLQAIVR